MSRVHCKLPRSGLGNQLFPLLKAHVFAQLNNMTITVTGYHQLKIGPWLRREKSKRNYSNYFVFQKNIAASWFEQNSIQSHAKKSIVSEPPVERLGDQAEKAAVYQFSAIPHYHDFFEGLRMNRELVRKLLPEILRDDIKKVVAAQPAPCIGVQIRMGDFRKLQEGEDFSKAGATRTPENYFIDCVQQIRSIHGSALPVSVFTDGYRHELKQLLSLENVQIVEGNRDIVDLLLLSRSKIIVASAGSTFSYWAGFLADAPLIMHPDHMYKPIRPDDVNNYFYEGALLPGNTSALLKENIRSIKA